MRSNLLRIVGAFSLLLCCAPDIKSSRCEGSVMVGGLSPVDCAPLQAECIETSLVVACARRPASQGCEHLYQCGFTLGLEGAERTEAECANDMAILEAADECDGACMALVDNCDEEALAACIGVPCGTLPDRIEAPPAPAPRPISRPTSSGCGGGNDGGGGDGGGDDGGCCVTCGTGKPCGDTCIARDRECNVGPGCACSG